MGGSTVNPRVIPALSVDTDDAGHERPRTTARRSRIDYAALVRRAQLRGERRTGLALRNFPVVPTDPEPAESEAVSSVASEAGSDADAQTSDTGSEPPLHADERRLLRERQLNELAAPFIASLAQQEARVAQLMHFLAARVADFCTDAAVVASGAWTIRIRLDEARLPDCTLHLTLSRFDLTLRFETSSDRTRQLVCRHADILRKSLTSLLYELETPRDVSIGTA
ncbi:type III secretion system protein SctP [Paraburkholderia rhizosphaerae]|uniref:Type III secretion control protein HpaP n=1 Tax=Paraburkholderia rhizosphaerae TaxID=480658 RepID=A0A4R8LLX7_9BURK|nr:type III secretion system protein SctP [Paraburkholderia rhizosphaerae]TDY45166.1 type III secretion control protein HpaP [Paraburkholderia rhizosphaerae]